jgi:hypothetical protein
LSYKKKSLKKISGIIIITVNLLMFITWNKPAKGIWENEKMDKPWFNAACFILFGVELLQC